MLCSALLLLLLVLTLQRDDIVLSSCTRACWREEGNCKQLNNKSVTQKSVTQKAVT
jgi:hypothetical protein